MFTAQIDTHADDCIKRLVQQAKVRVTRAVPEAGSLLRPQVVLDQAGDRCYGEVYRGKWMQMMEVELSMFQMLYDQQMHQKDPCVHLVRSA